MKHPTSKHRAVRKRPRPSKTRLHRFLRKPPDSPGTYMDERVPHTRYAG